MVRYGFARVQDFDAAAGYASESVDVSRACLAGLIPYFEPWGSRLAFAGKVRSVDGSPSDTVEVRWTPNLVVQHGLVQFSPFRGKCLSRTIDSDAQPLCIPATAVFGLIFFNQDPSQEGSQKCRCQFSATFVLVRRICRATRFFGKSEIKIEMPTPVY